MGELAVLVHPVGYLVDNQWMTDRHLGETRKF
jgi:hypothetical protein